MSWTSAQVKALAPEYASLNDSEVDIFIAYAVGQHNRPAFSPGRVDFAGMLLTAHLVGLAHPELVQGAPANRERVGQVEVQRALLSFEAEALNTTRHGIEYKRQIRLNGLGFLAL